MSDRLARVKAFVEKLLQLVGRHEGHHGVRFDQLQELVRGDPEAAAGAVPMLVRAGEEQRGFLQLAYSVALAYQHACEDDSLVRVVQRALEQAGIPEPAGLAVGEPPEQVVELAVNRDDLDRCDIYGWIRLLSLQSLEGASPGHADTLRRMRGRCHLTFPLSADPRAVWEIPEARAYVRALFSEMPYFPYYLETDPVAGTYMVFFGCLADPEALRLAPAETEETLDEKKLFELWQEAVELRHRQGKAIARDAVRWQLDPLHTSVLKPIIQATLGVTAFCARLPDDPAPVIEALLAPYPETLRQQILALCEKRL